MATRQTRLVIKNNTVPNAPFSGATVLKGEAIVNTADGILMFSGITSSTSEWTPAGPGGNATFFEVGSNLYDLRLRNQITKYQGQSGSGLAGKFLSGTTSGFVLADITSIYNPDLDVYVTGNTLTSASNDTATQSADLLYHGTPIGGPYSIVTENTFTTGGTYDNNTALITFDRNNGTSYNVDLSSLDLNDTFVTGGTVTSLGDLELFRNDNVTVTIPKVTYWTSGSTGTDAIKVINSSGLDSTGSRAVAWGNQTLASGDDSTAWGYQTSATTVGSTASGYQTLASGSYSHAEGLGTTSSGIYGSHSEGQYTTAVGNASHSEGLQTTSSGNYSHSEGRSTTASGTYSHSEGQGTIASGQSSHSEGFETTSLGLYSHAEGNLTTASGYYSHAEGINTIASGLVSHSEGEQTTASGRGSNAKGYLTIASGNYSQAEGQQTTAIGDQSTASGYYTIASGNFGSHSEGWGSTASGYASHAEGYYTTASNSYSHAEGYATLASGFRSHAEGNATSSTGTQSHAEGQQTIAQGQTSHAEGYLTTAIGNYSHTEGRQTTTLSSAVYGHAEGQGTTAGGDTSHAEGFLTLSSGSTSHAEGTRTTALGQSSHSQGSGTTAVGIASFASGFNSRAVTDGSFIHSLNSVVNGQRSVVLGGQNITGSTNDTVYVPYLNLNYVPTLNNSNTQILSRNTSTGQVEYTALSAFTSLDTFVTGFTYNPSNNTFTISRNQGQPNLTASIGSVSGLTVSNLTAGRVVYVGTGGLLTDEAGFEYNDGTNLLTVGNINVQNPSGTTATIGQGGLVIGSGGSISAPGVGDLTVHGDLTVFGNTTTISTNELYVEDPQITLNYNPTGSTTTTSVSSGIRIQDGNGVISGDTYFTIGLMQNLVSGSTSEYTGLTGYNNRGWVTQLNDIVIRNTNLNEGTPDGVRVLAEFDTLDGGSY